MDQASPINPARPKVLALALKWIRSPLSQSGSHIPVHPILDGTLNLPFVNAPLSLVAYRSILRRCVSEQQQQQQLDVVCAPNVLMPAG